jgi:hypothetical protein
LLRIKALISFLLKYLTFLTKTVKKESFLSLAESKNWLSFVAVKNFFFHRPNFNLKIKYHD